MGDIEGELDVMVKSSGRLTKNKQYGLSNDDFINTMQVAITAHKGWIVTLKSMAETMTVEPIQTDDHKCGFGHFYYSVNPSSSKILKLWRGVEQYHHSLHTKGDTVINHINKGKVDEARRVAREAEELSSQIVRAFENIITVATEMKRSRQRVF